MIYLDTSAAAKLVISEPESDALAVYLVERLTTPVVSSALLYPELLRAVNRHQPAMVERALALLQRMMLVPLAHDILVRAGTIGDPMLRTLASMHLATVEAIAGEVAAVVTYDKRLADAVSSVGVQVEAPGQT
jgi:predicted nucleic acid-binding protein